MLWKAKEIELINHIITVEHKTHNFCEYWPILNKKGSSDCTGLSIKNTYVAFNLLTFRLSFCHRQAPLQI